MRKLVQDAEEGVGREEGDVMAVAGGAAALGGGGGRHDRCFVVGRTTANRQR